jgi:ppGpp synthetase/RelA/SpoT-type nucleotidyltranferase
MIVPNALRRIYDETLPYVEALAERVRDVLSSYCRTHHFIYEDRIKSLDSVAEKVETGRFRTWADIDDLFAATIVVSLVTDEPEVLSFLKERFGTVEIRRRGGAKKPPDAFRFDSTRFIGKLKNPLDSDPISSPSIYDFRFEVQVKTVFEFAWTRSTHALAYKGPRVSWERQRLAAQLKAATEQMDMLIHGFDKVTDYVGSAKWPGVHDRARIEEFFRARIDRGSIPSELAPQNWTRFSDNAYRVLQIFAGDRPGGGGNRKVKDMDALLEKINEEITSLGADGIPRSISLLQFIMGILSSSELECRKQSGFYFLITNELATLYPKMRIPCDEFVTTPRESGPQQQNSSDDD